MAIVNGTAGPDSLSGTEAPDVISGGASSDVLEGLGGADTLYGHDSGHLTTDNAADTLMGGQGNDQLHVGELDEAFGGAGDDKIFIYGGGFDAPYIYAYGGEGTDTVALDPARLSLPVGVTISMAWDETPSAMIRLKDVEVLDLGDLNSAYVYGSKNADTILGGFNNDTILGGQGDDTIGFLGGNDIIDGGEGEDTLSFEGASRGASALRLKMHQTDPQQYAEGPGSGYAVTVRNMEHFIGSSVADWVEGTEAGNRIDGRTGADVLEGLGGADTLLGGQGADRLYGGAGRDELRGGNDNDRLEGGDDADTLFGEAGRDVLYGDDGADSADGGAGTDTIHGGEGGDTLAGGADADVLYGDGGDDLITVDNNANYHETASGGAGEDTLVAGWTGGVLRGGAGADRIEAVVTIGDRSYAKASYADAKSGILMDRRLDSSNWTGDAKGDTLINIHQVELTDFADSFYGRGAASTPGPAFDDHVWMGKGDDTVLGFGGSDYLYGEDGDDSLSGGEGMDNLTGGRGADWIEGGSGRDHLSGGLGDDTLLGGDDQDWINEKAYGDPTGPSGDDFIDGGGGDDVINHDDGNDTVLAGAGNDTIHGSLLGQQRFVGGDGDDQYHVQRADTVLVEDYFGGTDTVVLDNAWKVTSPYTLGGHLENLNAAGQGQKVVLIGNVEHNEIVGSGFNDTISGEFGDDVLKGGNGDDLIDGGDNGLFSTRGDTAVYQGELSDYTFETLENGDLKVTDTRSRRVDHDGTDILRNVEYVRIKGVDYARSELANKPPQPQPDAIEVDEDAITGNLYQLLLGNDSDPNGDALVIHDVSRVGTKGSVVFSGPDNLTYAADADEFDRLNEGETATDTFKYSVRDKTGAIRETTVTVTIKGKADADDWVELTGGNDARQFGAANDKVRGLEGHDSLNGGDGADTLDGGKGNDVLLGQGGADQLVGGEGDDEIRGGFGDKSLAGGAGDDLGVLDFSTAQQGVTFTLQQNLGTAIDVGGVQVSGFERVEFTGGSGNDNLSGGLGRDILRGGGGNDTLSGGGGTDDLYGGAGDDFYSVFSATANVHEAQAADGVDTVLTNLKTYTLGDFVENLEAFPSGGGVTFTGNGLANRMTGADGNDTLAGGAGADTLSGGGGADRLLAGGGADVLYGGAGKDRFVFDSLEGDLVADWQAGDVIDVLALEAYGLRLTMRDNQTRAEFDLDGDGQFDDGLMVIQSTTIKLADFDW